MSRFDADILDSRRSEASQIEDFARAVAKLAAMAESLTGGPIPEDALRSLLSTAVRLYAAEVDRSGVEKQPINQDIGTTEVVVTACALLRSQNLNAFDTALWFSRTHPV